MLLESGEKLTGSFYLDDDTFLSAIATLRAYQLSTLQTEKADISISQFAGSKAVTLTVPTETSDNRQLKRHNKPL